MLLNYTVIHRTILLQQGFVYMHTEIATNCFSELSRNREP